MVGSETERRGFRRFLQFSLRGILLLTFVAALVAMKMRPPELRAAIHKERVNKDGVEFRIENTSHNSLFFYGYSETSPFYSIRTKSNTNWKDCGPGWCGTGASSQELKSGRSTTFKVEWLPPDAKIVKVGVWLQTTKDETGELVWSDEVRIP